MLQTCHERLSYTKAEAVGSVCTQGFCHDWGPSAVFKTQHGNASLKTLIAFPSTTSRHFPSTISPSVMCFFNILNTIASRPQFYQTRSAWSMDQGSSKKRSTVHNFVPTVTKFCVMWEGLSLPQDTKCGNCRDEIVVRRVIFIWSLIHGSSWSGLIKVGPGTFTIR